MQNFGSCLTSRIEERSDGESIRCSEGDVRLTEPFAAHVGLDPELWTRRYAKPNNPLKLHDPRTTEGRKDTVVEVGAGLNIVALNREMIDHGDILSPSNLTVTCHTAPRGWPQLRRSERAGNLPEARTD
jgi:hypothetical protein